MTPTSKQSVGIEGHVIPSTPRPEPHNMPSTSNIDVPIILVELHLHASVSSTSELINNPSNVGSVRILLPRLEQVSLRSLIDSQSRMLRLPPDTPKNVKIRQEMVEQIQLWEIPLLESAEPTSDEQVKLF